MATLKEDKNSWHARSVMRRDARHDNEEVADKPSTGKPRGRKRGRCRDGHDFKYSHTKTFSFMRRSYDVIRCTRCGKSDWVTRQWAPLPLKQVKKADEKFFPVHDEGTCAVCDKRRSERHVV